MGAPISPSQIDQHTLSDAQYGLILDNKHQADALLASSSHNPGFPYLVPIIPFKGSPNLLKLLVENLYWSGKERRDGKRGVVAIEDRALWYGRSHKEVFCRPVRCEMHMCPFRWEAVNVHDGYPPTVLKAHATGFRYGVLEGEGEAGNVSFEVTHVRQITSHKKNNVRLRVEKVWQVEDDQEVLTFCATRECIPCWSLNSIIELRGVTPELDGYHVLQNVFPKDEYQEFSAFSFLGCELLGDKVDDDIYLICDHSNMPRASTSWAMQQWSFHKEGLYHVRINLSDAGTVDTTRTVDLAEDAGWGDPHLSSPQSEGMCPHPMPHPLAQTPSPPSPETSVAPAAHKNNPADQVEKQDCIESVAVSEAQSSGKEESLLCITNQTYQHDSPLRGVRTSQSPRTEVFSQPLVHPNDTALTRVVPCTTPEDSGQAGRRDLPTSIQGVPSPRGVVLEDSTPNVSRRGRALTGTLSTSSHHQSCEQDSDSRQVRNLAKAHIQHRQMPDIWNMGVDSKSCSVQSRSPPRSQGSGSSKTTARIGLGTKSSGVLDDSICPKSPRMSRATYNRRDRSPSPIPAFLERSTEGRCRKSRSPPAFTRQDSGSITMVERTQQMKQSNAGSCVPAASYTSPCGLQNSGKTGGGRGLLEGGSACELNKGCSSFEHSRDRQQNLDSHLGRKEINRREKRHVQQDESATLLIPLPKHCGNSDVRHGDGGLSTTSSAHTTIHKRNEEIRAKSEGSLRPTSDAVTVPDVPGICGQQEGSTKGQRIFSIPCTNSQFPVPPPTCGPCIPVPCTKDVHQENIQTPPAPAAVKETVLPSFGQQSVSELPKPPTSNLYDMWGPAEQHREQLQLPTPPGTSNKASKGLRASGDIVETIATVALPHNESSFQQLSSQGASPALPSPPGQLTEAAHTIPQTPKGLQLSSVEGQEQRKRNCQRGHMNPMTRSTTLGSRKLKEVCPEDSNLSGLKKPSCTAHQLQNAVIAMQWRLDEVVQRSVKGNAAFFASNDPHGSKTYQVVARGIKEMLPSAMMQRGDYLYVVPRNLADNINSLIDDVDLPEMIKGGLRLSLFSGLDDMYKKVRMSLSTNKLEESPSHLYQDIELDAQKDMDVPLLQPRLEHSADGTVLGKMYPGTFALKGNAQMVDQSPNESSSKVHAADLQLPTPPSHCAIDQQGTGCSNVKPATSSLLSQNGMEHLDITVKASSMIPIKDSGSHTGVRDVFSGFDVNSLGQKTNEELACEIAGRLKKNDALLIKFLVASIDDSGRDIFLDRFISLQPSSPDGAHMVPNLFPLVGSTTEHTNHTSQRNSDNQDTDNTPSLLSLISSSCRSPDILNTVPLKEDEDCALDRSKVGATPAAGVMDSTILMNVFPEQTSLKLSKDHLSSSKQSLSSLLGLDPELKLLEDSKIDRSPPLDRIQELMKLPGSSKPVEPKFMNRLEGTIQNRKTSGPLWDFQEKCVKKAEAGGNFIFVAPTGSGKTKIFVEITRRLLEKKPDAKVVVICPTVFLTSQQATVFAAEGFHDQVNAYSGENSLPPPLWPAALKKDSILVMTPQLLCSILDEGQGNFHEVDILVLDEIHHCKGDHPYSKLMDHYLRTPKDPKRAQVLGFTASPANSSIMEQAGIELDKLRKKTESQYVILNENNEEVKKYVPSATEENIYIEAREEDSIYALCMGQYLFNACTKVLAQLIEITPALEEIPEQAFVDLKMGLHSNNFENWCKKSLELLTEKQEKDVGSSIQLLRHCNITLELVKEGGYEAALRHVAHASTEITNEAALSQDKDGESSYKKLLVGLFNIKPIKDKDMAAHAFQMTWDLDGYRSFPRYVALVRFLEQYKGREIFHGIIFCRTRDAVYSLSDMLRHTPALYFVTAMEFIGHGKSARKAAPRASLIDGNLASSSSAAAARGMTGSKQRSTLEKFQSPGRHILVATRAAEEGMNVTTCAFVVRYSVTETGTERIQSRGRTRIQGGKFVNILENESREEKLFLKSVKEEATLNQLLKVIGDTDRIE